MVSTAGSYCFANMVAICGETDFPNGILGYLILGHIQLSEFGGYQSSLKLESFVNGPERLIPSKESWSNTGVSTFWNSCGSPRLIRRFKRPLLVSQKWRNYQYVFLAFLRLDEYHTWLAYDQWHVTCPAARRPPSWTVLGGCDCGFQSRDGALETL